jgi:LuxR family maltose regulon positive regulatory protein
MPSSQTDHVEEGSFPEGRIIRAKVGVPRSRLDVVSRPRLLTALDEENARVVLVCAPAGSGKTILAQDWLLRRDAPAAWLSLDALDNEPSRFFAHLGAALQDVDLPGLGRAGEAAHRLARSGGEATHSLLHALAEAEDEAVVVLDDCHLLEAPSLLRFLEDLVTTLRTGPRLFLLSRVDPPIPLSRVRLSGELLEIRERPLRFRSQEVAELFERSLDLSLPDDLVTRLEERTEGWAAGLRMAAVALRQADDPRQAAETFAGSHELLVDYLLEEVVKGQEPGVRRFLLETSVLPRFDEDACIAVTEDPSAGDHLNTVDEANLFLVALDGRRRWYRYHHLFADLLRFRLHDALPERVDGLHERASRWFEEEGDVQEALAQAAEMKSSRRLVELLDVHGYPILARSEFASFGRWAEKVPDPLSQRYPMFLTAMAWFRIQTERAPDLDELLRALAAAVDDPPADYPPDRVEEARRHLGALQAFGYRIQNRFDEALEAGRKVLEDLPPDAALMRGVMDFNMGAIHLRLANMDPARRFLERAHESCLRGGAPYLVLAGLGHRGAIAAQTEGLVAARQGLESAVAFARERDMDGVPAFAIILYQLAQVHYLAHELEVALDHLRHGIELTRGERETDIHANVLIHLARVEAALGRHDEAEEHFMAAFALSHSHNVKPVGTTFAVERARLAEARSGRLQTPEEAPPSAETGASWSSLLEAETMLRLHHCLRLNRRDEAARLANRLREESEPRKRGIALCVAGVAGAAVSSDAATRKKLLASALTLAASRGYVMPLVQGGPPVRALLEAGLKYPLPPEAQRFVRNDVLPRMPGSVPETGIQVRPKEDVDLTEREVEILALLARGLTNADMAEELFVSVNTVKTHLKRIFAKLDVSTRTQAAQAARRLGVAFPDEG